MLTAEEIAPMRAVPMLRTTYHQLASLEMGPMGTSHANAMRVLNRYVVQRTPSEFDVMVQLPLAASDESEPEPDFALLPRLTEASEDHPATALLVVEVADSSLKLDLGPKATLYAECQVPEYWVIDLAGRTTVVHRTPRRGKYSSVRRVGWTSLLTSTSVPALSLRVNDVLVR